MFKLPIEYVEHKEVDTSLIKELELTTTEDPSGISVYHKLFTPSNDVAKRISSQFANYYTTNELFLKETVAFHTKFNLAVQNYNGFLDHWNQLTKNEEFDLTYQYFKHEKLVPFNTSSKFMFMVSLYFVTTPLLYILSPIIMLLIPFALMNKTGNTLSWTNYIETFINLLKGHALGGLLKLKTANSNQKVAIVANATMFMIQLYCNGYSCYTFYKNIANIHSITDSTTSYLKNKIIEMEYIQNQLKEFKTYTGFVQSLEKHKQVLFTYYNKIGSIKPLSYSWNEFTSIGNLRAYFYELYNNKELKESIEYSIGFSGYIENISKLHDSLTQKKINACSFSNKTTFKNAYYPVKSVKNSYHLNKNIVITGPNASGKTTLIKTTMINVLLSQQLGCGFYKRATICPYDILCSYINIPDTSGRDSLFQAEARRCKKVIDCVDTKKRVFCIFDELFSGTNPQEASASAYAFLQYLSKEPNCTFLLTTHFIDVCNKLVENDRISMKNMKTTNNNKLVYTYKLNDGISTIKGGLNVLINMDYPADIIADAKLCG
jgi:hypothetical protein